MLAYMPNDLFSVRPIAEQHVRDSLANARQREETTRRGKVSSLHTVTLAERIALSSDRLYTNLYLLRPWKQFFQVPVTQEMEEKIGLVAQLLERAAVFSGQRGAEFVAVSLPQQFQVLVAASDQGLDGIDPGLSDRLLEPVADRLGVPWIPLLDPMAGSYSRDRAALFLRHNGHFNAAGNSVVASHLAVHPELLERVH